MEILPVINCEDAACIKKRAQSSAELVGANGWVHLDVADGGFTDGYATWRDAEKLRELIGKDLKIELHLLSRDPELNAQVWLTAGINRLIVHIEVLAAVEPMVKLCEAYKVELVLGIGPETTPEHIAPYLPLVAGCHVLAVYAGRSGQAFQPAALTKIASLRAAFPNLPISVDGGITAEVATQCKAAGATRCAVGVALWSAPDTKAAFGSLAAI